MSEIGPDQVEQQKKGARKKVLERPVVADVQTVDVDTPVQTLLQWDKDGVRLQWDFERFPELEDEVLKKLSNFNATGYSMSKGVADKLKRQEEERKEGHRRPKGEPAIESVGSDRSLDIIGGSAVGRTRVSGGRKDTHYCLKRTDELEESIDAGYDFVDSSDPVKTPGMTKVGGTRRIARHGEPEMFLMKIPKERYERHNEAMADIGYGNVDKARDGFHKEGAKLKKKYHLEYWDNTRRRVKDQSSGD